MSRSTTTRYTWEGRDQSRGAVSSVTNGLGRVNDKITATVAKFGAVGIAAGVFAETIRRTSGALFQFVNAQAKVGDELDKMSARTGLAVEKLSEYQFLVERGGGTTADMETAVRRLARSMSDARDGVKESVDAWRRLGIQTSDLIDGSGSLRELDQILPMLADGLAQVGSQAERMDLIQAIAGRGGTKLLPALQDGREGLKAIRLELERIGGAASTSFATKSAKFADATTNLSTAASRLREIISEPMMQPLTDAANGLASAVGAMVDLIKMPEMQMFMDLIRNNPWLAALQTGSNLITGVRASMKRGQARDLTPLERYAIDYQAPAAGSGVLNPGGALNGPSAPAAAGMNGFTDVGLPSFPSVFKEDMSYEEARRIWQDINTEVERFSDVGMTAASAIAWSMQSAFDSILSGARTVSEGIKSMFTDAAAGILSGLFRLGIGLGLNALFPGSGGAPGLGSMIGFAPRASGGTVASGGAYMVGERGPELFVPNSNGTIIPNDKAGGRGPTTIQVIANGLSTDDPLALRRLAERLRDELDKVDGYYYEGGAA